MGMTIRDALDDYWDTLDALIAQESAEMDYTESEPPDTAGAIAQARARLCAGWLDRGALVLVPDCMTVVYAAPNDAWAWARDTLACGRATWSIIVDLTAGRDAPARVYRLSRDD